MPKVRFKRWRYLTPLAPHVEVCESGRRYLWTNAKEGVVEVTSKADLEQLLNPLGDRQSDFEVAWECYGVRFDEQGNELAPPPLPPASASKKK